MAKNYAAWPEGWPRNVNYPNKPVHWLLDQTAARAPDRIAIHFGGMELTYAELKNLADRFAAALVELGVEKGDRAAVHLLNIPQFAVAYYGLLKAGAVFVPFNPLLSPREAAYQLNDCGAGTIISLDLMFPGVEPILKETSVVNVITTSIADCYNPLIQPLKPVTKQEVPGTLDMVELLAWREPFEGEVEIDPKKDLAHIAYTGGTTGVSKGVMLTHYNCLVNSLMIGNWFIGADYEVRDGMLRQVFPPGVDPASRPGARDSDTALVVAPWFHAMGAIGFLSGQAAAGNTMVVYPRFDPAEYISGVTKFRANILGGAPQLFIPIINLPNFEDIDFSSVKVAVSGAAPLPLTVLEKMVDAFDGPVCEAYGLTETTMLACCTPPFKEAVRQGSVGVPVFDTEVKLVDPSTGEDLPEGAEGEICIRGPQVMAGYWNRPEATAEVLTPDGWLLTGDIGRFDEDGYLYITDRKKDLILYKGYNVYPRELEEMVFTHPAVEQCAVVGRPDPETGEQPVAFVQLKAGREATAEEIADHVNAQVAPYKKLRDVLFVDAVPVSPAGKVLRRELRDSLNP